LKLISLDYGSKSIGVAKADTELKLATPIKTIFRDRENVLRASISEIIDIIIEEKADIVVIGLPLLLDGNESDQTAKVRDFEGVLRTRLENKIKNENININPKFNFQNEFYSTKMASEILTENGKKKKDFKQTIDQVAACLILEEYMNNNY
jgi:putative Holliday junction resolvase